jgi:hypothetical protein
MHSVRSFRRSGGSGDVHRRTITTPITLQRLTPGVTNRAESTNFTAVTYVDHVQGSLPFSPCYPDGDITQAPIPLAAPIRITTDNLPVYKYSSLTSATIGEHYEHSQDLRGLAHTLGQLWAFYLDGTVPAPVVSLTEIVVPSSRADAVNLDYELFIDPVLSRNPYVFGTFLWMCKVAGVRKVRVAHDVAGTTLMPVAASLSHVLPFIYKTIMRSGATEGGLERAYQLAFLAGFLAHASPVGSNHDGGALRNILRDVVYPVPTGKVMHDESLAFPSRFARAAVPRAHLYGFPLGILADVSQAIFESNRECPFAIRHPSHATLDVNRKPSDYPNLYDVFQTGITQFDSYAPLHVETPAGAIVADGISLMAYTSHFDRDKPDRHLKYAVVNFAYAIEGYAFTSRPDFWGLGTMNNPMVESLAGKIGFTKLSEVAVPDSPVTQKVAVKYRHTGMLRTSLYVNFMRSRRHDGVHTMVGVSAPAIHGTIVSQFRGSSLGAMLWRPTTTQLLDPLNLFQRDNASADFIQIYGPTSRLPHASRLADSTITMIVGRPDYSSRKILRKSKIPIGERFPAPADGFAFAHGFESTLITSAVSELVASMGINPDGFAATASRLLEAYEADYGVHFATEDSHDTHVTRRIATGHVGNTPAAGFGRMGELSSASAQVSAARAAMGESQAMSDVEAATDDDDDDEEDEGLGQRNTMPMGSTAGQGLDTAGVLGNKVAAPPRPSPSQVSPVTAAGEGAFTPRIVKMGEEAEDQTGGGQQVAAALGVHADLTPETIQEAFGYYMAGTDGELIALPMQEIAHSIITLSDIVNSYDGDYAAGNEPLSKVYDYSDGISVMPVAPEVVEHINTHLVGVIAAPLNQLVADAALNKAFVSMKNGALRYKLYGASRYAPFDVTADSFSRNAQALGLVRFAKLKFGDGVWGGTQGDLHAFGTISRFERLSDLAAHVESARAGQVRLDAAGKELPRLIHIVDTLHRVFDSERR